MIKALTLIEEILQFAGDKAVITEAAVISGVIKVVTDRCQFILEDQEIFIAGANDSSDFVAGLFEGARNRIGYRGANAATNNTDSTKILDVGWISERSEYVMNAAANFNLVHAGGAFTDGLHDQADCASLGILIDNGEWHAFAFLA